jgi:hypothetical protein
MSMVRQMAVEMGPDVSPIEAIGVLLGALAVKRNIVIGLARGVTDETLAGLFVFALLDCGVARPMPDA